MADSRYILKPLTNEDGKRGYRMEIDEFLADNEMTNLFLIALAEMQKDSLRNWKDGKPDWLTYYSLAGVHGSPREDWNGYKNIGSRYGFCHHSMNTFPTWHRPYIFLFESAVHREMEKQAQAYSTAHEKKIYLDAAARFRLPYWDLVMPRNKQADPEPGKQPDPRTIWGCPAIFKAKDVFVKLPKPDPKTVKDGFSQIGNPLASFNFPEVGDWAQHPERTTLKLPNSYNQGHTVRVPTKTGGNETNNAAVDLVIQRQATASAVMLWQMLNPDEQRDRIGSGGEVKIFINKERSWESFANDTVNKTKVGGQSYATVSLESFHDGIHVLIGTGRSLEGRGLLPASEDPQGVYTGHMGNPAYAAFDPIFWMHHNNIERLFCLFQALFPTTYADAEDSKVKLYPFMTGTGRDVYTSADELVKNYWGSGFAIPGDKKAEPSAVRENIKKYLNDTYYWAANQQIVPDKLPTWPKKLEGCWALYGPKATAGVAPVLQFSALAIQDGVPELVARKVSLHVESPEAQDKKIDVAKVVKQAYAVDSSLPEGALTGPASLSQPPIQLTWNAHIKVRKFAFDGSFSIHLFVGYIKDDQPERYMTKKNEVGFTGVFASSRDAECASCARNQADDILVEDVVPLTTFLYDYLDANEGSENLIRDGDMKTLPNLQPEHVVPFLKEHLHWRMIDLGATLLVGQEQQAKLEIIVTSRQYLPPTADNLMGVYGPYTEHPEITNTKPGGYGYNYAGIVTQ